MGSPSSMSRERLPAGTSSAMRRGMNEMDMSMAKSMKKASGRSSALRPGDGDAVLSAWSSSIPRVSRRNSSTMKMSETATMVSMSSAVARRRSSQGARTIETRRLHPEASSSGLCRERPPPPFSSGKFRASGSSAVPSGALPATRTPRGFRISRAMVPSWAAAMPER